MCLVISPKKIILIPFSTALLKTQDDANIKLETITSERDSALKRIRDLQWELQAARATVESRDRAADQAVALAKKDAEAREKAVVIERTALEKKLASCEEMLRGGSDEVAEMEKLLEQEREAHQATRRTAQQDVERERMRAGDLEEAHRSVLSQAEERSAEHAELQIEYNRLRSEHRELRAKEQVRFRFRLCLCCFGSHSQSCDLIFCVDPPPPPLFYAPLPHTNHSTHRPLFPSVSP